MRRSGWLLLLCIVGFQLLMAEKYIEVTAAHANIRTAPLKGSAKVATARKGDIFHYSGTEDAWAGIILFSGQVRHIHSTLVKQVFYEPVLPKEEKAIRIFQALHYVEGLARKHAASKYPLRNGDRPSNEQLKKQLERQYLLDDRYKLEVCHKYNVPPALYNPLVQTGVEQAWFKK